MSAPGMPAKPTGVPGPTPAPASSAAPSRICAASAAPVVTTAAGDQDDFAAGTVERGQHPDRKRLCPRRTLDRGHRGSWPGMRVIAGPRRGRRAHP